METRRLRINGKSDGTEWWSKNCEFLETKYIFTSLFISLAPRVRGDNNISMDWSSFFSLSLLFSVSYILRSSFFSRFVFVSRLIRRSKFNKQFRKVSRLIIFNAMLQFLITSSCNSWQLKTNLSLCNDAFR